LHGFWPQPLIKLDEPNSVRCDISVVNPIHHHKTQLLARYGSLDPRVVPLLALVKRWAKARSIG
jgi:DNA polymerase sigma